MKKLITLLFLASLTLLFNGCTKSVAPPEPDISLALVEGVKFISDVDSIAFEWDVSKDSRVVGYNIYRSKDRENFTKIATISSRYSNHFVDKNLEQDTLYIYEFTTLNEKNQESKRGESIDAKSRILEPISFIEAIGNYPKKIKIIWKPHENPRVSGYVVERSLGITNEFKSVANIDSRLFVEYIDMDLKDDMSYRYRVVAKGYNGIFSAPSQVVEAKTSSLPKAVVNISASLDLPKKIILEWERSFEESVTKYRVYRSNFLNGIYQRVIETDGTKVVDEIGSDGAVYYYKITAVDREGLEGEMPRDAVVGKSAGVPLAPRLNSAKITLEGIELRWESGDNRAKEYNVIRSEGGLIGANIMRFTNIKDRVFIDRDIEPNKRYRYQVVSVDEYGLNSKPSIEALITTPATID